MQNMMRATLGGIHRSSACCGFIGAMCLLGLADTLHADLLAGWRKTNSAQAASQPYVATTNGPGLESCHMTWTNFYKYNDNSWFHIEPWITNEIANGVSPTNYTQGTGKPLTNWIEFMFMVSNGFKISFTNMLLRGQNDERRLHFRLRAHTDDYAQDLITGNNNHTDGIWTNRDYLSTTNSFRNYTNALNFMNVTNRPIRLRLYGTAARSAYVYWYMTNLTASAYANDCMIVFEGKIERTTSVIPNNGPLRGLNTVAITNVEVGSLGNGSDITNVVVGVTGTTNILGQGTNWVRLVVPPGSAPGLVDMTVQSASVGNSLFSSVYLYNPTGVISAIVPSSGALTGGYPVAIVGSNLCAGDITNVVWGVGTAPVVDQTPTQVVVTAPAGVGTVNIRVDSISFGETPKDNAFTYIGPGLQVLGTNGALIASGDPASAANGTDFGLLTAGAVRTNWLAVTNNGVGLLTISGVTTNGAGAGQFSIDGIPTTLAEGSKADFSVIFNASVAGTHTAAVHIVSDGPSPYIVYLAGAAAKADQTISFPPIGDQVTTNKVGLAATASSGLTVDFAVGAGPASITGGTNLSFTGAGTVSIIASQPGNANWNPAPEVTNTFNVNKAIADVTLHNLTQAYDGTPRVVTATTAPTGLTVDITYDGSGTAPTAVGSYAVTGVVNEVLYEGMQTGTLTVAKGTAGVYLQNLAQTYDGTARNVTATTDPSGLTVEFTYNGHAWAPTNAGNYAVTGTVNDANWQGSAADTLTVARASQTITFPPIPTLTERDVYGLAATADSGLAVTFQTWAPGQITGPGGTNLSFTGPGSVSVVARQAGNANWMPAAPVTNTFRVLGYYTLEIVSAYGSATPPVGVYTNLEDSVLTNQVHTPDTRGTTQYLCVGWVATENLTPDSGEGTQAVVTVQGAAVLTWLWTTNYWLNPTAGAHGTVDRIAGWFTNGELVTVGALADAYYHFTNWTGDATSYANPLVVRMDGAKAVMAHFAENTTTNTSTPEWWLAQYGFTNNFEEAAAGDQDNDRIPTWQEEIADTNPTNPASYFHSDGPAMVYGTDCWERVYTNWRQGNVVMTQTICNQLGYGLDWWTSSGRLYGVEGESLLPNDQVWLLLTNFVAPGTTNMNFIVPFGQPIRMFRLNVSKP